MILFRGTLRAPAPVDFTRYTLTVLFERRVVRDPTTGEDEWVRASADTHPSPDGLFGLEVGTPRDARGPFTLLVTSPSGNVVVTREIAADAPRPRMTIEVPADQPFVLPENRDPVAVTRATLSGRVLTTRGEAAPNGQAVILWDASDPQHPRPLVTAETSGSGYFSAPWLSDRLARVVATVAGRSAGAIRLEEERLPRRVVLVVDSPSVPAAVADEDCACASGPPRAPEQEDFVNDPEAFSTDLGGKCIDFTMPNRVLEEFTYSAVVRTTQPNVKGFSAQPARPLPLPIVNQLMRVAEKADRFRALSAGDPASDDDDTHGFASAIVARKTAASAAMLHPQAVAAMLHAPASFTSEQVVAAERLTRFYQVAGTIQASLASGPDRRPVTAANAIDWDATPTTYEATSVAHGHVLTLKQVWRADGYSLGDLLYSLPLAPCQKKQIAVIDWDRRSVTARLESRSATESLRAGIVRDRDVSDVIATSLNESVRAGSSASTWAAGGGFGLFIGPLVIGGGGGGSGASSNAWQNSARQVSASALQHVSDRTMQAASATRSQRTTIVQTARQGETMRVETEVVANHNHCHAMTMEYFEVLRHFQVSQELAAVQECLFVPMEVMFFDATRALRWREVLFAGLRRPELAGGFDALERMQSNWANSDFPPGRYADEALMYLDGELRATFELPRPADTAAHQFDAAKWVPYHGLLTPMNSSESQPQAAQRIWNTFMGLEQPNQRDRIWNTQLAPRIAQRLVNQFRFDLVLDDNSTQPLVLDTTLVSPFRQGAALLVSIRPVTTTPAVIRARIRSFRISTAAPLPVGGRVIVETASARYRTRHLSHGLFADYRVMNDLSLLDRVEIPVRLDGIEKSNPRSKDRDLAARLLQHLNSNIEHYLLTTWMLLDENRRYILLDGILAPGAGGKSVASVVENRILGVVGNCLVLPVAPGYRLDPTYKGSSTATLFDLYRPDLPGPVSRISVPTRGVFAEAIMGACNACEKKDESRFWRWEEAPCGDEPTRIQNVSAGSRGTADPALMPTPFPTPLVHIQNAPDLPAPSALAAAMRLIGTPNLFRDLTGLDLNQQNAAQAFQSALDTAQFFGGRAADLAQQKYLNGGMDRTLDAIGQARRRGLIDEPTSRRLTEEALRSSVGDRASGQPRPTSNPAVQRFIDRAAASASSEVSVNRPEGSVSVKTGNATASVNRMVDPGVPFVAQPTPMTCWAAAAAMMYSWQHRESMPIREVMARLNPTWAAMFDAGEAIPTTRVPELMRDIGLTAEGPASYLPRGIEQLLRSGPLWIIADEDMTQNQLSHAEVVVGITGDGTPENTRVLIHDPSATGPREIPFTQFAERLEGPDAVASALGIYHF